MLSGMILVMKALGRRLCPKRLMSRTSNVASSLCNCCKKLRPTLIQRSPHSLAVLNVEPVCRSVGDGVVDMSLISCVDLEPIATEFVQDVELSFDEPEFMLEYDAAFRDKRAEDLADDRPVPKLSNRDKALLQQALVEHAPNMPDCRDLSQAHRDVADGLRFDDSVPLISHDNVIIMMGIIFKTMEAIEIWLMEYAVFYHRPFMVKHSDENKHYVIRCHRGCPSTVHARKGSNDSWRITSVV
jgi:hypothetical protein